MEYVQRIGVRISKPILLSAILLSIPLILQADWEAQTVIYNGEALTLGDIDSSTANLILLFVLSLAAIIFWYPFGKILAPHIGIFLAKRLVAGINATPTIEKSIQEQELDVWHFLMRFFNFFVAMFGLDFLFFSLPQAREGPPHVESLLLALYFLTLYVPITWILEDIGLRAINEKRLVIRRVSSMFERFNLRIVQFGSLLGIIASLGLSGLSIDTIPQAIRIIFVRTYFISLIMCTGFAFFFQSVAVTKAWKAKGAQFGKVSIKFLKR